MDILVLWLSHETARNNVLLQGVKSLHHPLVLIVIEETCGMKYPGVSTRSNWVETDSAANASDGPPENRPPHSAIGRSAWALF